MGTTNWTFGRLTTEEAEKALTAAGLPVDPLDWTTDEIFRRASEVLDLAADKKRTTLKEGVIE